MALELQLLMETDEQTLKPKPVCARREEAEVTWGLPSTISSLRSPKSAPARKVSSTVFSSGELTRLLKQSARSPNLSSTRTATTWAGSCMWYACHASCPPLQGCIASRVINNRPLQTGPAAWRVGAAKVYADSNAVSQQQPGYGLLQGHAWKTVWRACRASQRLNSPLGA